MEDDEHNHETVISMKKTSSTYDPHIWLDPIRAIQQAENIKMLNKSRYL